MTILNKEAASKELATPKNKGKKLDKREAIIEAATSLFLSEGYETMTIAQVAKSAGVAVGTVYLYFKNKLEILYAVKEQWDSEFVQTVMQVDLQQIPYHKRIRPLVSACFDITARQHGEHILMGLPPQLVGEIYQGAGLGKSKSHMQQMIAQLLELGIKAGEYRPVNTEAAAAICYNMVSAALENCYAEDNYINQDLEVYREMLIDALERWLVQPHLLQQA
jgi:TetR/AcrR family fatty acid metabolism transcriptional regulator